LAVRVITDHCKLHCIAPTLPFISYSQLVQPSAACNSVHLVQAFTIFFILSFFYF